MQQSVALLASDIPLFKSVIKCLLKKRGKKEYSHTSDGLSTHVERRDLGPGLPTTYCSIFSNENFRETRTGIQMSCFPGECPDHKDVVLLSSSVNIVDEV